MTSTIGCFATQGSGSEDEYRIKALLESLEPVVLPFDSNRKVRSALKITRSARRLRLSLVVMEGTGVAGGLAVLALRVGFGIRYVVSSGDAIAPYIRAHFRGGRPYRGYLRAAALQVQRRVDRMDSVSRRPGAYARRAAGDDGAWLGAFQIAT